MQALFAAILRLWRPRPAPKAAPAVAPKAQPKPAPVVAPKAGPAPAPKAAPAPAAVPVPPPTTAVQAPELWVQPARPAAPKPVAGPAPMAAPAPAPAPAHGAAMPAVWVPVGELMADEVDDMMRWAAQPGATGPASSPAAPAAPHGVPAAPPVAADPPKVQRLQDVTADLPAVQGLADATADVPAVQGVADWVAELPAVQRVDAAPGPGRAAPAPAPAPAPAGDGSITGSPLAVGRALRRPGKILLIGDSLSTTSRHPPGQGWPALVSASLGREIVNDSVGGSTVRDGIRRLPAALAAAQPTVVVLALGGNDGFERTPIDVLTADLREACTLALQAGALPVLLQMRTRTGTPALYARGFRGAWDAVAAELRVPLVPGFLDPLGDDPQWFEADRTHPNTRAQRVLADHVLAALRKLASAPA